MKRQVDEQELSFVLYRPGEDEFLELIGVVVGLSELVFDKLSNDLAAAQRTSQTVLITAAGGFSVSEDNRFSHQPTASQFQLGYAMGFEGPVGISVG